jgi:DNA polymerase III subunit delta'
MSATGLAPWPPAFVGTPAVAVIERAIARGQLARGVLLHGDDPGILAAVAEAIAERVLDGKAGSHPDCFALRPAGKMRQISADTMRDLIAKVQLTGSLGSRKVAIVYEADRMHSTAANVFLKTLEEPPASTTLLLTSNRPYALPSTIRSRCLHFRFALSGANLSGGALEANDSPWSAWRQDYRSWLGRLADNLTDKAGVASHLLSLYGLVARFGAILQRAADETWSRQKDALPPESDEDERIAIETGVINGLRARLFADVATETRLFAEPRLVSGHESVRRTFTAAVERLEHGTGLLRLNLNESAVLEDFLLSSMRLWAKR